MTNITDRQINEFFGEYERPVRFCPSGSRPKIYHTVRRIAMVKKDCFAYRRARCNVLTEMVCRYGSCSFYKTVNQDKADRARYRLDKNYQPKG